MTTPCSFPARLVCALTLGCALLAFAPAPSALAQKKMPPPVTLTPALLDQAEKVSRGLLADASALAELRALNHENELDPTVPDTDEAIAKKYPGLAKVYQAAGMKPHEFIGVLITLLVADRYVDRPATPDREVTQANVDFVKANRERVKAIIKMVKGDDK